MINKLDKAREIILRRYDQNNEERIADLESKLSMGFADIEKQIEGLKNQFQTEITALDNKIQHDKTERQELLVEMKKVTSDVSRKQNLLSREIASLDQKISYNNLENDKEISLVKKKIVDDISAVSNRITVENIKLESRLTELIKHELAEAGLVTARESNQKQKSVFDKIASSIATLESEIDALRKDQDEFKGDTTKSID